MDLNFDTDSEKIRKRIWLIPDGIQLRLGNMTIRADNSGKLIVTGWTNTIHFENITRENVLQELDDLKSSYAELSQSFKELDDIIKANDLKIEYFISYDDAGKVGIALCSEIDSKLNWHID